MKSKVNNTIDLAKTAYSGFNFIKIKPIVESKRSKDVLMGNYRNTTRNITYFKDILNYSRASMAMTSFKPNTNSCNDDINRMQTETTNFSLINEKLKKRRVTSEEKDKETLITHQDNKSTILNSQRHPPSLYDLDLYYNQFETPIYTKIESNTNANTNNYNNTNQSYSQTRTVLNSETYFKSKKRQAKKISTQAVLSDRNITNHNYDNSNKGENILINSESNSQKNILIDKITDIKKKKPFISNIKQKAKTPSSRMKRQLKDNDNTIIPSLTSNNSNYNYRLPESLKSMRTRLHNHTTALAEKSSKNTKISNIREDYEKTKDSGYTKNIIEQIKIVNNFISNQPEEKFKSDKLRHRKMFVIMDGQVIFTAKKIQGAFIEIPTQRYLDFLQTKKERLEKHYEFLSKCQEAFNTKIPFKSIFLLNGINVFELSEIPPQDKAVYISMSNIFRGVHLFNEKKTYITALDYNLLQLKEKEKNTQKSKFGKTGSLRIFIKKKTQKVIISKRNFKTIKKTKKYLNDQSFTFGRDIEQLEKEDYVYYSDNENKTKQKSDEMKKEYPTLIDQLLNLNDKDMAFKIDQAKRRNLNRLKTKLGLRPNEETEKGLNQLINTYNKDRGKKYNMNMSFDMKVNKSNDKDEEQEKALNEDTKGMGLALLKKLRIFKEYKEQDVIINENKFNDIDEINTKETVIQKNISLTYDVVPLADNKIQKYLPDLVSLNIPKVLKVFPTLKRRELYDIFVQFKTLLMFCVCMNKTLKVMKKGIDFDTFFNCNRQIKSQGGDIAQKIFKTINNLDSQFINWEQYMKGMLKMKSKDIGDKIDLFFKVIDTDGNGMLSYDEVYDLSVKSLGRSIGDCDNDDDIVEMLAVYFSNLIFQLVDLPTDEEIPLDLIREKIIEGKSAAGYLEMFICADNFT